MGETKLAFGFTATEHSLPGGGHVSHWDDRSWDDAWAEYDATTPRFPERSSPAASPRPKARPMERVPMGRMLGWRGGLLAALLLVPVGWGCAVGLAVHDLARNIDQGNVVALAASTDWAAMRDSLRAAFAASAPESSPNAGFLGGVAGDLAAAAATPDALLGLIRGQLRGGPLQVPDPALGHLERIRPLAPDRLELVFARSGLTLELATRPELPLHWRLVGLRFGPG